MPEAFTNSALAWLVQLLLITTRMSSMFILSPVLGRQSIPNAAKIGMSVLTAMMLINVVPPPEIYPFNNLPALLAAVALELLVGLVMGFGVILFFNIVYTAGHVIDMQIGFSMAQVFDQTLGGQAPVAGSLLNLVLMLCFISTGGIPNLVNMLSRTFEVIPPGAAIFPAGIAYTALESFTTCFILSLNVSMPLIASALLAEIALGIIVRTAPQMNVFVIGIPIKVIIGLVMLVMTIPVFVTLTGNLFDMMYEAIDRLLLGMLPV